MAQPQETLPDIVLGAGIRLKHYQPAHTEKVLCPKCGGGKTREKSLSVSIDEDGNGATWVCHRGSCGFKDGKRLPDWVRPLYDAPRPAVKPKPAPVAETENRPDWLHEFFGERCIGDRTVRAFGIYATLHPVFFPTVEARHEAIVFRYWLGGELVNRKYRSRPSVKAFVQDKNPRHTLFNVDRLGPAPEEVVFVEGEMDVLSLFECGIENAVSLKDGAGDKVRFNPEDKRFGALETHADLLRGVKRFILAGDGDGPGTVLREELARRLGRHRCWMVTWPPGCKDASDVLRIQVADASDDDLDAVQVHGVDVVKRCIAEAAPYPMDGIQHLKPGDLLALRHAPPQRTMTTGALASDRILRLPTEGKLIVLTGYPSGGKTSWMRYLLVHTAQDCERKWLVFSPEMQPWPEFLTGCAEVLMRKSFFPAAGESGMTDAEITEAESWIKGRIGMLACDSEDVAPTLDWILERARHDVLRRGMTDLLIDPFNEIAPDSGADRTDRETDYIGRCLQQLKAFALRHGVNVWIIAHPSKPLPLKGNEQRASPGPYDISGSAHWANKTDLGLTIHSPTPGLTELHIWKARHQKRWGKRGDVAVLELDEITGCYSTPVTSSDGPENGSWRDTSAAANQVKD